MFLFIILSVLCLSNFTKALPASVNSDAAIAEVQPAIVERDASIPPDSGPTVPACWTGLKCSFHQIEEMSLSTRLSYVQYMETRFAPLNAGNQFRAIEGVIKFFISKGLGGPGTWVSYVDAGIVEGIQRGGAIALGIGTSKGGNPGSERWADFLTKMKHKELEDRNDHDHEWSVSEQAATDYGKTTAESISMVGRATKQQLRWYQFTQLFRAIMRNRKTVIRTIRVTFIFSNPGLAIAAEAFVNWLTDITDITPTRVGSEIAWDLAALDLPIGFGGGDKLINDVKVLKALLPRLYKAYKDSKK
ncbi:hypothetical protein MMC07_005726 [Pseudocyphellaria aurata]|nr:hypothetical protein [Pseudocyphellaria aurata]